MALGIIQSNEFYKLQLGRTIRDRSAEVDFPHLRMAGAGAIPRDNTLSHRELWLSGLGIDPSV
jgi:hypothetical protein